MTVYTIKDIAALAGVGISTVSRVLNHRPDVSEATRKRVMDVVNMHNYAQNMNAKNLKQRNADLVSLIVRGRQNSFLSDIAEHIIEYGEAGGESFQVDFLDESGDEIAAARRHVNEKKVPALVFLGANIVGRERELAELKTPCVFTTVDTSAQTAFPSSSVSVDNRRAAEMAIGHLLDRGHRRIAVFGGTRHVDDGIGHRYEGVLRAFSNRGLGFDEALYVECSFGMEKAYRTAKRFLSQGHDFTAVFAVSDIMAIAIIKALDDAGLRVPQDVSVVGFDGIALSRFTLPTLTTVAQPTAQLARTTVELVSRLLKNPKDREHAILESSLLEGGSVRSLLN